MCVLLSAWLGTAPENIAYWVVTLNEWRLANCPPMQGFDPRASSVLDEKVGLSLSVYGVSA